MSSTRFFDVTRSTDAGVTGIQGGEPQVKDPPIVVHVFPSVVSRSLVPLTSTQKLSVAHERPSTGQAGVGPGPLTGPRGPVHETPDRPGIVWQTAVLRGNDTRRHTCPQFEVISRTPVPLGK